MAVDGVNAFVNVAGGSMHSYAKYGIYASSHGHSVTWSGVLIYSATAGSEPVFRTTSTATVSDSGNIRARTVESMGDATVRGSLYVGTNAQALYTVGATRYNQFNPNAFLSYNTTDPQYQLAMPGAPSAMNLHPGGLSLLGQPHIAWKVLTGTTDGAGAGVAAHGVPSLVSRLIMSQATVTTSGGNSVSFNNMVSDGTNISFSGAEANRPWRGLIVYSRDLL